MFKPRSALALVAVTSALAVGCSSSGNLGNLQAGDDDTVVSMNHPSLTSKSHIRLGAGDDLGRAVLSQYLQARQPLDQRDPAYARK